MSYIEHAKREFRALGYKPIDECEDGPDKWVQESVLELLDVFSKQGHSGSSAPYCINLFKDLSRFKPLTPLTFKDDEWCEVHDGTFQNIRMSSVFKDGKTGKPYYLNAMVFETPNGSRWHGNAIITNGGGKIGCSHYIDTTKPFKPKTFAIKVREVEVAPDDWEFFIDDGMQLNEVFNYYMRK